MSNSSGKIDFSQDMKTSRGAEDRNPSELVENADPLEAKASISSLNQVDSQKLSEIGKKRQIGAMILIVSSLMMMILGLCFLIYRMWLRKE